VQFFFWFFVIPPGDQVTKENLVLRHVLCDI